MKSILSNALNPQLVDSTDAEHPAVEGQLYSENDKTLLEFNKIYTNRKTFYIHGCKDGNTP
jgi:hypothetical protein